MFVSCNVILILLTISISVYSLVSIVVIEKQAKDIYIEINKEYNACFGKNYERKDSYFTDITAMKLEITTEIVSKSLEIKNKYLENIADSKNDSIQLEILNDSLSKLQGYNKTILYKESPLPLINTANSLYMSLNYMAHGTNALLLDIYNFSDDEIALTISEEKDISQVKVMATMSNNLLISLNKAVSLFKYITPFVCLIVLLATVLNIYRIRAKRYKYKRRYRITRSK